METFFYYATRKMNKALKCQLLDEIDDIRDLFEGERVFYGIFLNLCPYR